MWREEFDVQKAIENVPATVNVWDELNRWVVDDIAEMLEKRVEEKAKETLLEWAIKVVKDVYSSIYDHKDWAEKLESKYLELERWKILVVRPAYRRLKKVTEERLKELREKVKLTRWNWKVYKRKEREIRNNPEKKLVGETLKQLTNRILDLKFGSQVHKALAIAERIWVIRFLRKHGIKVWYEWVKDKDGKLKKVWKAKIVDESKAKPLLELFREYSEITALNYCRKVYEEINAF